MLGNQDVDPDKIAGVLGGVVPEGMSRSEYDQRIKLLAGSLTGKKEGNTKLKAYIAEVKAELTDHLAVIEELTEYKRARGGAERPYRPDCAGQAAPAVPEETRSLYDSALRRLAALQKPQSPPPGPGQSRRRAMRKCRRPKPRPRFDPSPCRRHDPGSGR